MINFDRNIQLIENYQTEIKELIEDYAGGTMPLNIRGQIDEAQRAIAVLTVKGIMKAMRRRYN